MIIDAPEMAQLPALRALWKEAFGDTDAFLDSFEHTAFSPERCRCITSDGQVVAALYWFDCSYKKSKIAYIYAVATAISHRGQGLCRKLMDDTHRHLASLGYDLAILVPGSKELFSFYEKMGYSVCCHIGELSCIASDSGIDLKKITAAEYGRLRRSLIPDGGVIQENENLEFLETMAELYSGEGFILAAQRRENRLYGSELLGDVSVAPKILSALGCSQGSFRICNGNKPFAMCYPLLSTAQIPSYLGLAFD